MKAQFATIEAIIALSIALSAMYFGAESISAAQHSLFLERYNASSAAAAYDFLDQLEANYSTRQCIYNAQCQASYSAYYQRIYGIVRIGIIKGNSTAGNYSKVYCREVSNSTVCVGVS